MPASLTRSLGPAACPECSSLLCNLHLLLCLPHRRRVGPAPLGFEHPGMEGGEGEERAHCVLRVHLTGRTHGMSTREGGGSEL